MGASCSDNYNRAEPIPPSQAVGGGCGVSAIENYEINYVEDFGWEL